MALTTSALQALTQGSDADAWRVIVGHAVEIASKPLAAGNAPSEVVKRDREIGALDLFLSSSGWDLWQAFGDSVERTSDRLVRWWAEPFSAKAVLILDGLSLRELPWLLQGAKERGFTTHEVAACASELPGETDEFARALGFSSRSRLQNNGGGLAHKLQAANTETMDLPWRDCEAPDRQRAEPDLLAPLARRQAARHRRPRPGVGTADKGRCRATEQRRLLELHRASRHRTAAGHHL